MQRRIDLHQQRQFVASHLGGEIQFSRLLCPQPLGTALLLPSRHLLLAKRLLITQEIISLLPDLPGSLRQPGGLQVVVITGSRERF